MEQKITPLPQEDGATASTNAPYVLDLVQWQQLQQSVAGLRLITREEKKQTRKALGRICGFLLLYMLVMNVALILVSMIPALVQGFSTGVWNEEMFLEQVFAKMGWGYFVSALLGIGMALLWKKSGFFRYTLLSSNSRMTAFDFLFFLCLLCLAQFFFGIVASMLEFLFNLFGMSLVSSIESATGNLGFESIPLLIYMAVLAPISEEIIFRGAVMRTMEPYGRKFAVVFSALLFGLFHGNLVQIPFAFAAGLIFAYVAMEYSIWWSIGLHFFNNAVVALLIPYLSEFLPEAYQQLPSGALILLGSVAAVILLAVRRKELKTDLILQEKINRSYCAAFFSAFWTIVLIVIMLLSCLTGITFL